MELRSGAKLWNEIRGQQPKIEDEEQARCFEEGIRLVLARWTALGLAVEHGWGGPESEAKSQSFQHELYRWFLESKEQKYVDELEDLLEDVMVSDFNTELQDGSPRQVAEALVGLYEQCAVGDFSTVERMRSALEDVTRNAKHQSRRIQEQDHDCGSNPGTTSSPNDVDMDVEDIPTLDPDGWEVVTNNKKKGRDRKKCHE